MSNRILINLEDSIQSIKWIENIEPFAEKILNKLSLDRQEVSFMFCNDEFIKNLNCQYRNIDSPTDVLSFENGEEYEDEDGLWKNIGDIVISIETLPKNAQYFEVDENTELKRLIIHGILHLVGYDHGEEHIEKGVKPECEMLNLQENMLLDFAKEIIIG